MAEVTKGDLMFFQNDVLGDMKKLESKLNSKIEASIEELKSLFSQNDTKNNILNEKFEEFFNSMNSQNKKNNNEDIEKLKKIQTNIEELIMKLVLSISFSNFSILISNFLINSSMFVCIFFFC